MARSEPLNPDAPSALLQACDAGHTSLVASLLDLPIAWDLREIRPSGEDEEQIPSLADDEEDEDENENENGAERPSAPPAPPAPAEPAGPSGWPAVSLLLRSSHGYGYGYHRREESSLPSCPNGLNEKTFLGLEMIRRGASPIFPPMPHGASPVASACDTSREEFLRGLAGHPEFTFERIVGLKTASGSELLSFAVSSNRTEIAKALIEVAGWPVNRQDASGMLPIGYARTSEMIETLLSLGADPALRDAEGLNALARIQNIDTTSEREAIMSRLMESLRKGPSAKDPSVMAALREENAAALFKAAQEAPKSTLTKLIASFKFDVAKLRDPKTGRTPLMAALLGGRVASAKDLVARGCDINAVDRDGISAAAYLLLGNDANSSYYSRSSASEELLALVGPSIDWSLKTPAGIPVALQPALMPEKTDRAHRFFYSLFGALKTFQIDLSCLRGPEGEPFARYYLPIVSKSDHYSLAQLAELGMRSLEAGQVDGALLCALEFISSKRIAYEWNWEKNFDALLDGVLDAGSDPERAAVIARTFSLASKAQRKALAERAPERLARLEALSLATLGDPAASKKARPRGL